MRIIIIKLLVFLIEFRGKNEIKCSDPLKMLTVAFNESASSQKNV